MEKKETLPFSGPWLCNVYKTGALNWVTNPLFQRLKILQELLKECSNKSMVPLSELIWTICKSCIGLVWKIDVHSIGLLVNTNFSGKCWFQIKWWFQHLIWPELHGRICLKSPFFGLSLSLILSTCSFPWSPKRKALFTVILSRNKYKLMSCEHMKYHLNPKIYD